MGTANRWLAWLAPLSLLAFLFLVWLIASGSTSALFLPSPRDFFARAADLFGTRWFWNRTAITFGEALLGSLVGAAVAIPTSWLIHRSRFVNAALQPFLGATQAIPAVALAPLLVLWVGRGLGAIVLLCALMVFFPILVATTVGLRHLDQDVIDAASLDGAHGLRMIISIEAPLVAPSLLGGIRNGFTLSVTGAVIGEMVMGGAGLGQLLSQQQHNLDTAGMFVTVAVLCALAMVAYSAVYLLERRGKRLVGNSRERRGSRNA
ncbi:ABC transporter permease [Actinomyces sp. F1_1611]